MSRMCAFIALLICQLFTGCTGSRAMDADNSAPVNSPARPSSPQDPRTPVPAAKQNSTDKSSTASATASSTASASLSVGRNSGKVIHVLVALCDNQSQGIVPVPARIGNGDDPQNNLYWGAAFGVKTFLSKSQDWKLVARPAASTSAILERCVFRHRSEDAWLIADAYRGAEMKRTIGDLMNYSAGAAGEEIAFATSNQTIRLFSGAAADLIIFVGHNGLMDFSLEQTPLISAPEPVRRKREVMVFCCISKNYFRQPLLATGASPVLMTTGLMAPEAYILKAAVDGWLAKEPGERIRERAALAYNQYQKCGLKAARNLFYTEPVN